ncbi:hypothetical protein [Bradyrhizobium sp. WD16]|uniref:hypothetical protein n=1 Tax=Bradyrhizobium sp. WD16 TaxID=1521768 RepID=UPI0020A2D413|nr:hypothetical protein [Bradyrhizobium sp. WD16]
MSRQINDDFFFAPRARSLNAPIFDIHYNVRFERHNDTRSPKLKYVLVVSVTGEACPTSSIALCAVTAHSLTPCAGSSKSRSAWTRRQRRPSVMAPIRNEEDIP